MSKIEYAVIGGMTVIKLSVAGGWTTVRFNDGKENKVRNSMLKPATEADIAGFKAIQTPRAAKASADAEKPAKVAKPAKPAAKPVNPANRVKLAGKAEKPVKAEKPTKSKRDPVSAVPETGDILSPDGSELVAVSGLVRPNYDKYIKHEVKSPSGRKALDIGDPAADLLRGQDIADCFFIVAKNLAKAEGGNPDDFEAELHAKYDHLNIGMQRMNLGNRLRKALGIYGNLNAHKTKAKPREPKPAKAEKAHDDLTPAQQKAFLKKYGRRSGDKL